MSRQIKKLEEKMPDIGKTLTTISRLFYLFLALYIASNVFSMWWSFTQNNSEVVAKTISQLTPAELTFSKILSILVLLAATCTVVMFILVLVSMGRSIAKRDIFNLEISRRINRYAIVSMTLNLLIFISYNFYMGGIWGSDGVSTYMKYASLLSNFISLTMWLLLGQVMKIGYVLKRENDLTV